MWERERKDEGETRERDIERKSLHERARECERAHARARVQEGGRKRKMKMQGGNERDRGRDDEQMRARSIKRECTQHKNAHVHHIYTTTTPHLHHNYTTSTPHVHHMYSYSKREKQTDGI